MASRSSQHFNSENYTTTRRARSLDGDMGWEMFPSKLESTDLIEDVNQLDNDRRETLKDFTPDISRSFAYEEPRRTTYARNRINLINGARTATDPWKNEDFDTQFHDHDPRGWSTEQPWQEYRRIMEANQKMVDLKDDGDYSVPSMGLSPYTMYNNIRSAQNWVKDRLKIFSTAYGNSHRGGAGIYPNISKTLKSDIEDSSVLTDGTGMSTTFEDPVNRQHHTTKLSNIVHGGSKALRVNTTSDHRVKVAAYGKLYKQRGLQNHETKMRTIADDTPWSKIEGKNTVPQGLIKLMSSAANGNTAAANNRLIQQNAIGDAKKFSSTKELKMTNRNNILTKDIMALLGVVENDIKFLESAKGKNKKQAQLALANLYKLAETVHKLPAHAKIQMRKELLIKTAGGGIIPGGAGLRHIQNYVVINPKIIHFMKNQIRSSLAISDNDVIGNKNKANMDSENKLDHLLSKMPLFLYKSPDKSTEDIISNTSKAETQKEKYEAFKGKTTTSYKNLGYKASQIERNTRKGLHDQRFMKDDALILAGKNMHTVNSNLHENIMNAELDTEFGENKALTRHVGRIGIKSARRNQQSDYHSVDCMNEIGNNSNRKNPYNH